MDSNDHINSVKSSKVSRRSLQAITHTHELSHAPVHGFLSQRHTNEKDAQRMCKYFVLCRQTFSFMLKLSHALTLK